MNRTLGIAVVALWLASLAVLFQRDVLPYWRAQEPPRGEIPDADHQVGITDSGGRRIGTSWVSIRRTGGTSSWNSFTELMKLSVAGFASLPPVAISTTLDFQADGSLGSFESSVLGMGVPIRMEGHLLGIDYSCLVTIDQFKQPLSIDARFSRQLGESLRPFTQLPNLHVGQTWQVRIVDPVSLLQRQTPDFRTMLVTVVGKSEIEHRGEKVECFQVESDGAWAWVNRDGRVLVQTVLVPLVGKITLTDEPFDGAARMQSRRRFRDAAEKPATAP